MDLEDWVLDSLMSNESSVTEKQSGYRAAVLLV